MRLHTEPVKILNSPEIRDCLIAEGAGVETTTPEELMAFVRTEIPKWAKAVKDSGATWVVTEAIKWRAAQGDGRPLYWWRDNIGNEVDLLLDQDGGFTLVEMKAGQTFQRSWLNALHTVSRHIGHRTRRAVVYGGDSDFELSDASVIGWRSLSRAG